MSNLWGVVPAAGSGRRMATEVPKQYLRVAGSPLLEHALQALLACSELRRLVVVLDPTDRRADEVACLRDPRVATVAGGLERADSVLSGLRSLSDVAGADDWVLVHDAARPCLPPEDMRRLIDAVLGSGCGGLLAQPITDTVKRTVDGRRVVETLDRTTLWRAQTPQIFRWAELCAALEQMQQQGLIATDEASAMEQAGYEVQIVEGSARNFKVTVPDDLPIAEYYLKTTVAARL